MDKKIKIECPAKINLSLDVIGKRSDGYHELKMIMHTVNICDYLEVGLRLDAAISIVSDNKVVPCGEENTVYKAAKEFFAKLKRSCGVQINIKKNIPIGAGMAGGSTDAAGTLKALNLLTGNPFLDSELEKIGKEVGADVPFFIRGGCQLCEGIGDILTPLPEMKGVFLTVAKPDVMVSTPWVYKNLTLDENSVHSDTPLLISALEKGEYEKFSGNSSNTLETVTAKKYPEINEYKNIMQKNGAFFAMMTGSGSAVFGLFRKKEQAERAANCFKEKTDEVFVTVM